MGLKAPSSIYALSRAALVLQHSRVAVTETAWPVKPEVSTIWPFAEKAS